jgi:IclR family transcriptional regulator, acetate operon repressor
VAVSPGGVQSIARAMSLLETVARHQTGLGLSQIAAETGLPLPTIHRLVRTLVELGYLRQEPSRAYALGPRLLLLTESSQSMLNGIARPHLAALVDRLGETANLAILDGDRAAYLAQVPSRHPMRMFTEVGRRVMLHCTGVGKALAATLPPDDVRAILERAGMPARTDSTITDPDALLEQLAWTREHGYALDDGEQEVGVRCVAVDVPGGAVRLALSVSGPAARMSDELVQQAVPLLQRAAASLAEDLA